MKLAIFMWSNLLNTMVKSKLQFKTSTQAKIANFYHELSKAENGWYMLHDCILMHEIHFWSRKSGIKYFKGVEIN